MRGRILRRTCYSGCVLQLPDDAVNIFTDGSSRPKPRRGGVGYRIVVTGEDGLEKTFDESPNGYPGATNNEMELRACIEALDFLGAEWCPVDVSSLAEGEGFEPSMDQNGP
jgi:ribonuclease HI